ncbi:CinA family protein [Zobellella maritima]|uniref:CinA family protein n=1 Tax=Zobellella maritima TaxID=2059725 RepID=UPI000E305BEE|nr:nicotinamide-nucleotide amidohydrolase family protein [Zobellella maritima]
MHRDTHLTQLAQRLGRALSARGFLATTAESCTGGGVAYAMTEIAGSSVWFDRSFVTYSNGAKTEMLGVPAGLIAEQGAVSEAVAIAMAKGACAHSDAQLSVAISGIAGPGGGTPDKPVGTVWLAWYLQPEDKLSSRCLTLAGDRSEVRLQAIAVALEGCLQQLS